VDNDEALRPRSLGRRDLDARTNDPVNSSFTRKTGQPSDLIAG